MIGVWAALPVKGFAGAKQRLAPALTPPQRQALAAAMLEDVLEALAAAPLDGILVNTSDPQAAALARAWGAEVIADDAATGHTGAVAALARHLAAAGRLAMLALPGDIPRVTPAEIAALCDAAGPAPSFTIVAGARRARIERRPSRPAPSRAAALRRRQLLSPSRRRPAGGDRTQSATAARHRPRHRYARRPRRAAPGERGPAKPCPAATRRFRSLRARPAGFAPMEPLPRARP